MWWLCVFCGHSKYVFCWKSFATFSQFYQKFGFKLKHTNVRLKNYYFNFKILAIYIHIFLNWTIEIIKSKITRVLVLLYCSIQIKFTGILKRLTYVPYRDVCFLEQTSLASAVRESEKQIQFLYIFLNIYID